MKKTKYSDPRERSRMELAALIDQVQRHPLCPDALQDAITDALIQAQPDAAFTESPAGISIYLAAHETAAKKDRVRDK